MIRYVHGSEDSLDVDVYYVFDEMPSFKECQEFCSNKEENRNIIVVKNGIVVDCFKGTPDEINNGLFATYYLHQQQYPNVIEKIVPRDTLIKSIRVLRCLLSHCSRTKYRSIVKEALKSPSWEKKIEALNQIDFKEIDDFGKSGSKEDVYKVFSFQLGQVIGLIFGQEFYTKSLIANEYPGLRKYLYREKNANMDDLIRFINIFIETISIFNIVEYKNYVEFKDFNKIIDLNKERYIGVNDIEN